ncbi:MAG: dihydrolipoamide acetyltransferase family protein [Actinomycetota bacterium]
MGRVEFALPDVGEGLEEGEIVSWLVHPGDTVARDQPLVEVQTDKALVELPSPVAGQVVSLAFSPGDIVKVGQVLVVLEDGHGGDTALTPATQPEPVPPAAQPTDPEPGRAPAPIRRVSTPGVPAPAGPYVDFPDVSELRAAPAAPAAGKPAAGAKPGALAMGRPKAAPAVRKLALDRGVDLSTVTGTGPGGRILASDVEAAARAAVAGVPDHDMSGARDAGSAAPAAGVPEFPTPDPRSAASAASTRTAADGLGWMEPGRHPLRGIRRVTAEAMARSWSEIPHLTTMDEIDATGLLAARRRLAEAGIDTTIGALLVAAVARGLRRYPVLNASLELPPSHAGGDEGDQSPGASGAGTIVIHPDCNIGLAVATAEGLVVPVIRQADRRTLQDLAAEVKRLTEAARHRRVAVSDLRDGTFTISNYGALGGRFAAPLIRPPEVGSMGFGAIRPRPFVVDGEVKARPTLPWSLSADHRLIDGDVATAFAEYVTGLLADPVALLAELLGAGS